MDRSYRLEKLRDNPSWEYDPKVRVLRYRANGYEVDPERPCSGPIRYHRAKCWGASRTWPPRRGRRQKWSATSSPHWRRCWTSRTSDSAATPFPSGA